MKRAQAALEFLMLVGFMMAIFVVFYAVIAGFFVDFHQKENQKIAYDLLQRMENEIKFANQGFDGYQRKFTLPPTLDGDSYVLDLNYPAGQDIQEITVVFRDKPYVIPVVHSRVFEVDPADLDPPNLDDYEVHVAKTDGNIYVSSKLFGP